jgi:hypothetical protein
LTLDHANRLARFAVGELATFAPGPRAVGDGASTRWRMEIGSHWHRELRAASGPDDFQCQHEVGVSGTLARRGWRFELEGRIDQLHLTGSGCVIREIKTTLEKLPRDNAELRAAHPSHFIQLGLYVRLSELMNPAQSFRGQLLFVEAGTGLQQGVAFNDQDRAATEAHLDFVADFLEQRHATLARLRRLTWHPAFTAPRPGQETILADLAAALSLAGSDAPPAPVVLASGWDVPSAAATRIVRTVLGVAGGDFMEVAEAPAAHPQSLAKRIAPVVASGHSAVVRLATGAGRAVQEEALQVRSGGKP